MNQGYSQQLGGFFDTRLFQKLPSDARILTEDNFKALWQEQSNGKVIAVNEHDELVAIPKTMPPVSELLIKFKNELRPLRNQILVDVVQIALVEKALGNDSIADEVIRPGTGVRDRLRDITDDPALNAAQTREEMEAAVLAYYAAVVATVSPTLRAAFKDLDR